MAKAEKKVVNRNKLEHTLKLMVDAARIHSSTVDAVLAQFSSFVDELCSDKKIADKFLSFPLIHEKNQTD